MRLKVWGAVLMALAPLSAARGAAVVINEIFYNAPGDLDDLQWVELYNADERPADLSGLALNGGKLFTFPDGTKIDGRGFLVVALSPEAFAKAYEGAGAIGPLKRALKRGGETIRLDAAGGAGGKVDEARYKDEAPWPVSADGYSSSLERICPTADGTLAENWAASPLPADVAKAGGTPGKPNTVESKVLPPVVAVERGPALVALGQALRVVAQVKGGDEAREVSLLYRVMTAEKEGEEAAVVMAKDAEGKYVGEVPAQAAGSLLRYRVKAIGAAGTTRLFPGENDLRPTLSAYVHGPWEAAPISQSLLLLGGPDRAAAPQAQAQAPGPMRRRGFGGPPGFRPGGPPPGGFRGPPGGFRGFGGPGRFGRDDAEDTPRPPRGSSAFIYVEQATGVTKVFDYVSAPSRGRRPGFKVHFNKDRPLHKMTSVTLMFEGSERSLLAEALSYDVYRAAGNPAPLTEFTRLSVGGQPQGYHLIVERPSRGFLRRNKVDDHGNLYKARWFGQGIVGQHVKKTHPESGHDDLLALVDLLNKTERRPDAQWAAIEKYFDVDGMATHYAVNLVLSHWDGFFNNYYTYHDTKRDKWTMYPWDHDQTWGITGGGWGDRPLVTIPLNFGANGAVPPGGGQPGRGGDGPFDNGGPGWWRPPGYFSGPLLAHPKFRKVFLARVKQILDEVYTEQRYVPMIDELVKRLGPDAGMRAEMNGGTAEEGRAQLKRDAEFLKAHLRGRREYLLRQKELREVGK